MFFKFLKSFFGSRNDRILKDYSSILRNVNSLESKFASFSDHELKQYFLLLKNENNKQIFYVMPIVYAIVREVAKRTLSMRHFDVQILAGIALFNNKIVEVATGEGKTLVATLPVCLKFIFGIPVHIITVNEYLASRDADWMKPIYNFLGLSVSCIFSSMDVEAKKKSYKNDVVYGTASEFGFDYLRNNLVFSSDDKIQSSLLFAIIDEVDSILIDEARTPLIISIPDKVNSSHYILINKIISNLEFSSSSDKNDFILDFKSKSVYLTDSGYEKIEYLIKKYKIINPTQSLYDSNNIEILHIVYSSLRAKYFFNRDVDYIVKNSEVLIIDENTGRIMDGRRWSDGLHQAIEAKENLRIRSENYTLASITFQNFFRLYNNLSGMTGTAITESAEFESIYNLEVVVIPTNKINVRIDYPDLIFLTKKAKYKAIINDIKSCYDVGRPVLVGTISIEVSELLSKFLSSFGIKHNILNAKYHDKESKIIAEAGSFKNVTISTNMAGRGTDIVLGGSVRNINHTFLRNQVVNLGGLKVIGSERHESRRIDNQLRGRCARQGDPGCTCFYVSMEDDLIKVFIGDTTLSFLNKFSMSENDVISHPLVNKSIENAQRKVESYNFDIRKQLLEYDDIVNEQRRVFYQYRDSILFCENFLDLLSDLYLDLIDYYQASLSREEVFISEFIIDRINSDFLLDLNINDFNLSNFDMFKSLLVEKLISLYKFKRQDFIKFNIHLIEKSLFLQILDLKWRDHLSNLEYLKKGIYLRGYAQKDPKEEYKAESFFLFKSMLYSVKHEFINSILRIPFKNFFSDYNLLDSVKVASNVDFNSYSLNKNKIGRNESCYCSSGKKYKHCHGRNI